MSQTLSSRWLICRICLKSEHKKLYNIFEPIVEEEMSDLGTTLVDKIELCGAIKLQRQQNLPNQICSRCVLLLRAAYKFRDLCLQSQNQLKQFFTTLREKVEQEDEEVENNRNNNSGVVNFESDNEEQKQEDQDENNVILSEADYVVEESVTDYDSSEEHVDSINAKAEDYIQAIDDEETEFPGFSDDEERQYVVEEVDAKQFVSEDNEDDITTYKYEEDMHSNNIILEEQPRKTSNQMYFKRISGKKLPPAVKRKRKNSQGESFNGIYNCKLCDNSYTDKSKYNNHIKIHAKDKPHECEICKKRFSTTPQLSRHMNSHTGNRPYKCKYCEARFGDPSTKIKHERIHTNERPYKCNLCLKAFAYSNVLKVHMMTHTGEKPHMCEYCGKTFSQQHHKNAHEKRHTSANMVMVNNSSPDIEYMEEDELKEYKIEEII